MLPRCDRPPLPLPKLPRRTHHSTPSNTLSVEYRSRAASACAASSPLSRGDDAADEAVDGGGETVGVTTHELRRPATTLSTAVAADAESRPPAPLTAADAAAGGNAPRSSPLRARASTESPCLRLHTNSFTGLHHALAAPPLPPLDSEASSAPRNRNSSFAVAASQVSAELYTPISQRHTLALTSPAAAATVGNTISSECSFFSMLCTHELTQRPRHATNLEAVLLLADDAARPADASVGNRHLRRHAVLVHQPRTDADAYTALTTRSHEREREASRCNAHQFCRVPPCSAPPPPIAASPR